MITNATAFTSTSDAPAAVCIIPAWYAVDGVTVDNLGETAGMVSIDGGKEWHPFEARKRSQAIRLGFGHQIPVAGERAVLVKPAVPGEQLRGVLVMVAPISASGCSEEPQGDRSHLPG